MEIENYNCQDTCIEKYCDEVPKESCEVEIGDMKILFMFCEKHMHEFEKNIIWRNE